MFVIFRNNSEERIINTDQINTIFRDEDQKEPYFRVEYSVVVLIFIRWNGVAFSKERRPCQMFGLL